MEETLNEIVYQTAKIFKETTGPAEKANATGKLPPSTEGMAVAYGSLVVMAILPIFFGSYRSVKHHKEQQALGEKPETITRKEAAMFPIISSAALFSLYLIFKFFSKDNVNLLVTVYFLFLGILSLCNLSSPILSSLVPAAIPKTQYHLRLTENNDDVVNYKFNLHDVACLLCCSVVGLWYIYEKHWIANNLFGIAFAINGVELLHLNNIVTGCILLCGLFVYDIFWVFGTNVMVSVATKFEAPIKLIFPQDLLEKGLQGKNFAMLGLGDIVIPGIFIALLLRFDHSLSRKRNTYFYTTFFAYFVGLLVTLLFMKLFNHAQPALLYLVPACIVTPLLVALVKGDLKALFSYEDHPSKDDEKNEISATKIDSKKEK